ncbi:hypothetical protein [Parafilimonas sp.]|uniref:hypothetical protein n=1 Tax=Parafilimonas sp. TaxID=1969739 RepID=UPI0039E5CB41
MKKFLFSAAVVMSAMGIAVANSNNSAKLPVDNKAYILNDTTPSDTTTTKPDSSFLLK